MVDQGGSGVHTSQYCLKLTDKIVTLIRRKNFLQMW